MSDCDYIVCMCEQEEEAAYGRTVLCVDIDCIMCADFKDLSICRNVSVLDLKTLGACKFLQEPYSAGPLLISAFFLVEKALYATYSQIQLSAPLMQLIPTHLLRPSVRATSSKKASESPL